ncbi:MAG: alpha/beta hydrolase [Solobacterium sp.]|nr:alpha/beta hydrolase [Solobacterium sp.]
MIDHADENYTWDTIPEFTEELEGAEYFSNDGSAVYLQYIPDVVYSVKDNTELHLQIIRPTLYFEPEKIYPIVILIKGSAWLKQEMYTDIPMFAKLAERGFIVAVMEYRHSGIAKFPAQNIDAKNAIRFMRAHAAEYCGDPDNIFLMGGSSGGHVAVVTGMTLDSDLYDEPDSDVPAEINGIIDMYGPMEMTIPYAFPINTMQGKPGTPEYELLGFDMNEHPERMAPLLGKTYLDHTFAPMLIIHGTKDRMCNFEQTKRFYNDMKAAGKDVRLVVIRGADHGGSAFWCKEALDVYEGFIREHLKQSENRN